tara:strand:- start:59 stop:625 length:567 start_codon:yes stop_codon:yes gene_type:complete
MQARTANGKLSSWRGRFTSGFFGNTAPYYKEIGELQATLQCYRQFPESALGDFVNWRKSKIKESRDSIIAGMKKSYIETSKAAVVLRRNPEQSAALVLANLNSYFDDIAADQVAFNSDNAKRKRVTHARKLLPHLEVVTKDSSTVPTRVIDVETKSPRVRRSLSTVDALPSPYAVSRSSQLIPEGVGE